MKTEHKWHKCDDEDCFICSSGLGFCMVCHGGEGSLTTDCCGRPITPEEEEHIYNIGDLDFRDGKWVCLPNFTRFEGDLLICVDGVKRTKEEFHQWCEELKVNESTVTDVQLTHLLSSGQ